jgi:hypothetical protein
LDRTRERLPACQAPRGQADKNRQASPKPSPIFFWANSTFSFSGILEEKEIDNVA